jgi:hypothetical protein
MNSAIVELYNKQDVFNRTIGKSLYVVTGIVTFFSLLAIVVILQSRMFIHIDFKDWNIQKCNPKYIFYSGYIKSNPNSTAYDSTLDNFNDCVVKYGKQMDNSVERRLSQQQEMTHRNIDGLVSNAAEMKKMSLLEERQNEKRQILKTNKSLNFVYKKQKSEVASLQAQTEILVNIVKDIKEYLHSYLTYAIMNFAFKHRIQQTYDSSYNRVEANCSNNGGTSSDCNKLNFCIYDDDDDTCKLKSTYFAEQARKWNDKAKQKFGGNKL